MKIEAYSFGAITIDGTRYDKDVIILPDRVVSPWWRGDGHRLSPADLEALVGHEVDVLVIGTGDMGVMRVPKETSAFLEEKGFDVRVERTGKAVEIFNSLGDIKKAAALHLTC